MIELYNAKAWTCFLLEKLVVAWYSEKESDRIKAVVALKKVAENMGYELVEKGE